METLVLNLKTSGTIRRETMDGRSYLVAPFTSIVPGVLNGSKGPIFYPPEENAKNVDDWNGKPLTLGHPIVNGVHVTARRPDILNSYGLGFIFNSIAAEGKLKGEAWFDVEKVKRVHAPLLASLEALKPVEISTGLFIDFETAPEGAVFNGKAYSFIARNYKPDHLAILVDQLGACSVKDGCGVHNAERVEIIDNGYLVPVLPRGLRCLLSNGFCVNCGGKGSNKPGPCPTGGSKGKRLAVPVDKSAIRTAVKLHLEAKKGAKDFDFKAVDSAVSALGKLPKADLFKAAKAFGVHTTKGMSSKSVLEQIKSSIHGRYSNATRTRVYNVKVLPRIVR